jgi:hypothetical protein
MSKKYILFISILALTGSCIFIYFYQGGKFFNKIFAGKNVAEGVIEYEVTYPKLDPNSLMAGFLPDKAYLRFKNNNMITEMSGMMFKISYISNQESKSVEQTFSLLSQKSASHISLEDLQKMNGSYLSSIEEGTQAKEIAGFSCKEAKVKLKTGEAIRVFYTNEIGITNPNWSNPYSKLDGVLMDFQLESYGLSMHLTAKSVLPEKIEDSSFRVSNDHNKIPFADLDKLLREAMAN